MGVYENKNGNLVPIAGATLWADAPIGCIQAYGGATAPSGWLICNGAAVSRTTYAALFTVIGTSFGAGDGTTTFNLPDLRNKFLEGASTTNPVGTVKSAGLPNIKGNANFRSGPSQYPNITDFNNAFKNSVNKDTTTSQFTTFAISEGSNSYKDTLKFNAHDYDSIYSDNVNTVQPPAVCTNYIIKAEQVALPVDIENAIDTAVDTALPDAVSNYIESELDGTLEYTLQQFATWKYYDTEYEKIRIVDANNNIDTKMNFAGLPQGSDTNYVSIGQTSNGAVINMYRGSLASKRVYISTTSTTSDVIQCYGCDF